MAKKKYTCLPIKVQNEACNSSMNIMPELDDYAYFHSMAFESIFGKKKRGSDIYGGAGFLKVSRGNKSLYLKYYRNRYAKKHEVMLSYFNQGLLGIDPKAGEGNNADAAVQNDDNTVLVSKASWLAYNWNNRNLTERWNFRVAAIGIAALIVMDIPQFIISLIQFFK